MALHSLPQRMPSNSEELIEELDEMIQPPVVQGPLEPEDIQQLVFEAGRRSVVDQLLTLLKRHKEG